MSRKTRFLKREAEPARPPSPLPTREWEGLCKRCGLCCLEKICRDDGTILVTDEPCRFLNPSTRLCLIYEHRFEACPDCLPITEENLPELTWLPESCGYVEHMTKIRGTSRWRNTELVIWPEELRCKTS